MGLDLPDVDIEPALRAIVCISVAGLLEHLAKNPEPADRVDATLAAARLLEPFGLEPFGLELTD